jgi:hypothetical protein
MTKYLIWIAGLRGPEPQLCYEKPVDGTGKPKSNLAIYQIDDNDHWMGFKELVQKYPAPEVPNG